MSTNYIVNNVNYSNVDLYKIFQLLGSSTPISSKTSYIVNNVNYTNLDLSKIFLPLTSGTTPAALTGFTFYNSTTKSLNDLSDVFEPIQT
jgi:hypothetical protein